jgi:uncharacterized protein
MPSYGRGYTGADIATERSQRPYVYSDIDIIFRPSPVFIEAGLSGDIVRAYDRNAIKQSVRQIVLTNHYERPWKPFFGCNLRSKLFEPLGEWLEYDITEIIEEQLRTYEPRIKVEEIIITQDPSYNELSVKIDYQIKPITAETTTESLEIQIQMERIR